MIIDELRAIATQQHIILIGVSHITKSDARSGRLDVHAGKHSSSIAQKADKVISITGLRDSVTRIISSLKARDEGRFVINCTVDPKNFIFEQQC
jgi:RecA-family ATPase